MSLETICRVTVYAESAIAERLIPQFLKMGSTGYTVVDCHGKGEHDTADDPFGHTNRVRVELLVQPAVGEKIVIWLASDALKSRALAACIETVQVAPGERY